MTNNIHSSWSFVNSLLHQEPLASFPKKVLSNCSYQPEKKNIFKAFETHRDNTKVVILGQDPYPTPGHATGLAFHNAKTIPVSLKNIYKEIGGTPNIDTWTEQGVLLLNTALTVQTGVAGSHLKYWKDFTKNILSHLSVHTNCVYLLWGKKSQDFEKFIHNKVEYVNSDSPVNGNIILKAPHPAAEAYAGGKAGFFGCGHFKTVNEILKTKKQKEILW